MGFSKLVVYGLWFGAIFVGIMAFGESILPGSLADSAFSTLGLLSVFALLICDSLFSLGSASED
ncbi:Uncharacterised protein [uncultured archaeon]|nr:Uncharacterised protein [uncultured archaeon]